LFLLVSLRPLLLSCLFGAVGTALLLAGCSGPARAPSSPDLPAGFPGHSANDIRTLLLRGADSVTAYRARARISVRTRERTRTFNAQVRHRRADSLFMRVSLFGVEGGRLLLTRDSVFFYDTRRAVLRVGPLRAVQALFPAPVSSPRFFQNMLGLIAPGTTRTWSVTADSSLYYMAGPRRRARYTVDPAQWRVVRFEQRSRAGSVRQKRLFSNFRTVQGLVLPGRVLFERPAADLRALVQYQDLTLNPTNLSFGLNVPPDVPRRPFSQQK
jgi:hypothetical protein